VAGGAICASGACTNHLVHNVAILEKILAVEQRIWYAKAAIQHGWSRNILVHQIESGLYHRQGQASVNFDRTLPSPQSELARDLLKDPYNFDFLTLGQDAHERDLERGLLRHIREFLIELGVGFAFVGSQYRLTVGNQEFFIDLLFYHLKLRAYVVVDLKMSAFAPEFAGKMNFYLSAVDDLLRHPDDQPSIGIILCKTRERVVAEYALRDIHKPIGISEYRLAESLPEKLQGSLPTIEELENELGAAPEDESPAEK
jgi:predicted nuclease of restriction endonuclease-like (RecB) superfamily